MNITSANSIGIPYDGHNDYSIVTQTRFGEYVASLNAIGQVAAISIAFGVAAGAGALGAWCVALPVATGALVGALGYQITVVSALVLNTFVFGYQAPASVEQNMDLTLTGVSMLATSKALLYSSAITPLVAVTPGIFAGVGLSLAGALIGGAIIPSASSSKA